MTKPAPPTTMSDCWVETTSVGTWPRGPVSVADVSASSGGSLASLGPRQNAISSGPVRLPSGIPATTTGEVGYSPWTRCAQGLEVPVPGNEYSVSAAGAGRAPPSPMHRPPSVSAPHSVVLEGLSRPIRWNGAFTNGALQYGRPRSNGANADTRPLPPASSEFRAAQSPPVVKPGLPGVS